MQFFYEGADISEEISVSRCWHETHAQGRADSLMLDLNDKRRLWDKWGPKIGDSIEVREGAARSGRIGNINWDNVQDSVTTAGGKIVELFNGIDFSNAGQWKIEAFQRIGEVVIDLFNRIDWNSLADGALNALNGFGGVVIDLFERIDWDKVIGTATDLLNGLGETVLGLIERIPWATIISGATTANERQR